MRSIIIVEGDNVFELPVRRNQERFEIRVHLLKGLGGTSFILWESSIGHFAKSTSRANTVLSRKVDLREALCMLLHMSEDFLRGVPESLVHNVVIDFAHGGDVVRSNYWDRSNPKNDVVIVFWVWPKPQALCFVGEVNTSLIASDFVVTLEHFAHRNKACSSSAWHMEHLGECDNFLIP